MLPYQPTDNEIAIAAARLNIRRPGLGERFKKAAPILADIAGNFDLDHSSHWLIRSQTKPDLFHTVTNSACNCPDYHFNAPNSDTPYFCKHRLALHAYRYLLIGQLTRRTVGNLKYHHDRKRAMDWRGSIIIDTDRKLRALYFTGDHRSPRPVCNLTLDTLDRMVPKEFEDYQWLAEWIPTVPDYSAYPKDPPRMEDFASEAERQPEWTQSQFRHWVNTGELPALADNF